MFVVFIIVTGDDYYEFVDEFMQAIYNRWPQAVVQFEDFEASKAVAILNKYRYDYRCFNDDIQGTGGIKSGISVVYFTGSCCYWAYFIHSKCVIGLVYDYIY